MSTRREDSLSKEDDLETDFVPLIKFQKATKIDGIDPYRGSGQLHRKDLVEEGKTSDSSRCDSGIGTSIVSIPSVTSPLSSLSDPKIVSLGTYSKTSVPKLSEALSRISVTDVDDGIGSFGTSQSDRQSFDSSEVVGDGDKITPEVVKNLMVNDSMTKDEGFESYPLANKNINETEVDLEDFLAETDEDGDTLIHTAVVSREEPVATALIDLVQCHSKCLDIGNKLFQTPLHLAVLTRQRKIVQTLVSKGCDLMMRDQQGNTALHIACRDGSEKLVKDIVGSLSDSVDKRKELFNIRNCEGLTCLHLAAQGHYYEIMGYLFAKGADVNIGDAKSGRTILHYAVERKDVETVVVLLTHPTIDIDCETYKGETPLLLAYWRNYQDIVKRLKANGAYFSYDLVENEDDGDDSWVVCKAKTLKCGFQ